MLKAVIFDLDDTLFDHLGSARHGLICLRNRYPAMKQISVRELEDRYSDALETVHVRQLSGELTPSEARTIRMRQLFRSFEIQVDDAAALAEYQHFRRDYDSVCELVPGSNELLKRLKEHGLQLAIMTNNIVSEQIKKLRMLDLETYFDVVAISEEVGFAKPDPKIYHETLRRIGLQIEDVVMVGNSLASDIAGATNVGMRSVWLDRRPDEQVECPSGVARIERDFSDVARSFKVITSCQSTF